MSAIYKLRNKTISAIELDDLGGITIQASADYDVFKIRPNTVARSFIEGDLAPHIASGDIVLVTTDGELSQFESDAALSRLYDGQLANHIDFIGTDSGSLDSDDVVNKTLNLLGSGGASTNASGSTITVAADGDPQSSTPLAQMFELTFTHLSSVSDAWVQTSGVPSNETPLVVPWDSKLAGLTFSNKEAGADVNFEFYKVAEGAGTAPTTLEFTWVLTDARVARKTNFSPDVVFTKGDKIALFAAKPGGGPTDPSNLRVIMHMIVTALDETENTEDFSGNIT